ncbi:MAG: pyruvate carboxyltransferase [Rikenellaceae bacterium]
MFKYPPIFVDTTLRDGEQASGVAFTLNEKVELIGMLSRAGITEFEVGTPAMGRDAIKEIKAIVNSGVRGRKIAWCRAKEVDIELAQRCGVDGVHLSFPLSDRLLTAMGKSREWVLDEVCRVVSHAYESFDFVSIGAQDSSRADRAFLMEFIERVKESGAKRVSIADTVGILNPFSTRSLIASIRAAAPDLSIVFHAHNDLGMACANSLSAWMAGADALSTTINGLGERAGNAPFEEVVMAIEKSVGLPLMIQKSALPKICSFVEHISGRQNSPSKPIVGELSLTHESGIHTKYLQRDRSTYQLFAAEEIGLREQRFRIGKHTCIATLRAALEDLGVLCRDEIMPRLLDEVRRWCTIHKRDLTTEELVMIYKAI